MSTTLSPHSPAQIKEASKIALGSVLNLTFLPAIAFIWLLLQLKTTPKNSLAHYHLKFSIKLNLCAGVALILVSLGIIIGGGLQSGWTWVFVITYFVFVHTTFIMIAVWTLIRAWSGQQLSKKSTGIQ